MAKRIKAYLELTKPRIAVMVLATTALGFTLAGPDFAGWSALILTLLGTGMVGGGASVLNQFLERDVDALMHRTRNRPLPTGTVTPAQALYFGVVLVLGGCFLLLATVNVLAAFLALQSSFLYVLVYTPMKRLTWWNTSVGAIPGAMPPLIGWAGASGTLDARAWALFLILYIWQHPHFFSIAWIYREDYGRGGFKMLSLFKPRGDRMFHQLIAFALLLVPVSLLPSFVGITGWIYLTGALFVSLGMLAASAFFAQSRSMDDARLALRTSLVYLPALFLVSLMDAVLL